MAYDDTQAANIERFSGFEQSYDQHRPSAPPIMVEILTEYLRRRPDVVVDLGSGTGLSSLVWVGHADRVIGVETNDDMRAVAASKIRQGTPSSSITFMAGYSDRMGIPSGSVDIVTCSQSFHWMPPQSTLREVSRILTDGGVFAAFDCDWPPTIDWEIERAYIELLAHVDELMTQLEAKPAVHKWDKEAHLENLRQSGAFRYTKEVLFHHQIGGDAERYVGLAITQGGLQTVLKLGNTGLVDDIDRFRSLVETHFDGRTRPVLLSYRMRLGIK